MISTGYIFMKELTISVILLIFNVRLVSVIWEIEFGGDFTE